jgi:hypothetical protein
MIPSVIRGFTEDLVVKHANWALFQELIRGHSESKSEGEFRGEEKKEEEDLKAGAQSTSWK